MNKKRETRDETPDLDQALCGWDERRQAAKDVDGLLSRIMTAHDKGVAVDHPYVLVDVCRLRRNPTAWFAMGAVAAMLVAALLLPVLRDRHDTLAPDDLPPQYAWLNESQLSEKAALLREMEPMFENRLQWVAETEGRVVMLVRQEGQANAEVPKTAGVAIRVVVVRQEPNSKEWMPVWAVDVVTRQEQVVHLTPTNADLPPGTELSLWAYGVDDDVIAVDSRLSLAQPALQVEFNDVQRPGVPATMRPTGVPSDGRQYRVFQTISLLDSEV